MDWGYCLDFQVCISILKSDMAWRDSGMAMSDILHLVLDLSQAGLGWVGVINDTGPPFGGLLSNGGGLRI